MEILKKTILQAVTTGITTSSGSTDINYVIIPDTGVTYNLKIGLKQIGHDLGFMDAYIEPEPEIVIISPDETFYILDSAGNIFADDNNDRFIHQ